jgi:hypothetical protein
MIRKAFITDTLDSEEIYNLFAINSHNIRIVKTETPTQRSSRERFTSQDDIEL